MINLLLPQTTTKSTDLCCAGVEPNFTHFVCVKMCFQEFSFMLKRGNKKITITVYILVLIAPLLQVLKCSHCLIHLSSE